jgi:hypothetical protein
MELALDIKMPSRREANQEAVPNDIACPICLDHTIEKAEGISLSRVQLAAERSAKCRSIAAAVGTYLPCSISL